MYYYANGQRIAMRVAEMPAEQPGVTPTPEPTLIPAPTATAGPTPAPYPAPTPAAYEGLFSRFIAFLNELFGAQPVSAAALEEVTLAVDAPLGEVYFLLGDHLGSTTITLNLDGSVKSEIRYDAWGKTRYTTGTTPTERHYTGQIEEEAGLYFYNARWYDSYLSRWLQPDTIVPYPFDPLSYDRYAYTRNNTINRVDTSGHADQVFGGGCDDVQVCKREYVEGKASIILRLLGGRNDLEAMAQIVELTQSIYKTYDQMMPVLTAIFTGQEESNPVTIWNAAMNNTNCGGLGRDPGDCSKNAGVGNSFSDVGFHPDFQDGHNQLFHFWSYVSTVAATDSPFSPLSQIAGLIVSEGANVYHEIIDQDVQSTWQDYGLSVSGIQTGLYIGLDIIPPDQLGDYLRESLGPSGYGSYGFTTFMISRYPLQGNK